MHKGDNGHADLSGTPSRLPTGNSRKQRAQSPAAGSEASGF